MVNFLKKEWFFSLSFFLFLILFFYQKPSINSLINSIDFSTIRALFALMIITTAIKESNFFDFVAIKSLSKIKNEKELSFLLIAFSFFLSMFLTNDITLFIIIPLTLSFAKAIGSDFYKLIIFETIATNVGSALTPFGNPQNLFLFKKMQISTIEFIEKMSLIVIPQAIVLILFISFIFKNKKITPKIKNVKTDKFLFFSSLVMFFIFLIALEFSFVRYALFIIVIFYFLVKKDIFKKIDYILLFTFIFMFMDFYMLSNLEIIKALIPTNLDFIKTFNIGVILSQIISNVPTAIFLSHFSTNYTAIAYATNIGGNGLVISSLANFIAIRFIKRYFEFHKYSIPFFIVSYLLVFLIISYLF